MNTAIMVIVLMGIVGIVFGFILAYGNKKFAIEVNPLIHIVEDILPKGQCGACGFAGCQAYAEAVVLDPNVEPTLCIPGKKDVAEKVAELTGKKVASMESLTAYVKCSGSKFKSVRNYRYDGVEDCAAAALLLGGPKGCQFGCIGFGTCVKACPFDAMTMNENGLPVVDKSRCTGCGKCKNACPKNIIEMLPKDTLVTINCNSKDKGVVARKLCTVACIGCGLCSKNCPHSAIKIENNLAVIDSQICLEKCNSIDCLSKCPTGAIEPAIREIASKEKTRDEKEIHPKVG